MKKSAITFFLNDTQIEYASSRAKFEEFHSGHEGYAVLLEEFQELWDLVKASKGPKHFGRKARMECVQIAAMALAFAVEVCDDERE